MKVFYLFSNSEISSKTYGFEEKNLHDIKSYWKLCSEESKGKLKPINTKKIKSQNASKLLLLSKKSVPLFIFETRDRELFILFKISSGKLKHDIFAICYFKKNLQYEILGIFEEINAAIDNLKKNIGYHLNKENITGEEMSFYEKISVASFFIMIFLMSAMLIYSM